MKGIKLILCMFVCFGIILASMISNVLPIEISIEDAILKGDWKLAIAIFENDKKQANDPVARLIMAHACLATNRNNASMLLFLSAKEEKNLKLWSQWTESLLHRHPQNHIALYLSADAKARTGKLKEAIEDLKQALRIKADFAMAYNARGVINVLVNDWNQALVGFDLATKLAPDFADAYANYGTLGVLRETSLNVNEGTLDAFNNALNINPEFALAYNGLGCIYFGSGQFEEAAQNFHMASQLSPVLVVADINQGYASAYASKLLTLASILEKKPGTTLKSLNQQYPNILKTQHQQLQKMLPTRKHQEFWRKINTFQHLSNDQISPLINEHGLQKVQMGVFLKNQEDYIKISEYQQKSLALLKDNKINLYNRLIIGSQLIDFISSLASSSLGLTKRMQEGWKLFLREAG